MNDHQLAYLTAYTPQGVMEYRTTNFEEVYKFKKTCKEIGCDYAVRFRDVRPSKEHIVKTNKITKVAKDFIHWFMLR